MRRALATTACLLVALVPAGAARASGASISGSVLVLKKHSDQPFDRHSNAVVWLSGIETPPESETVVVDQRDKKFMPRLLPVVKGQVVSFINRDRVQHNVFSSDPRNPFDLGRYPKGEQRPATFEAPGFYRVYCDIHKSMILDVVVLQNRYFAVTDEDGVFRIDGVPEGEYRLHVWHVYGGSSEQPLAVRGEPIALEPITVKSTMVVREAEEHLDKEGRRYPKKREY